MVERHNIRIGIDLGGTKIEAVALRGESEVLLRERVPTPAGDYAETIHALQSLVGRVEAGVGASGLPIGIGHPGVLSPATGLIKNANSTCLNGRPLKQDLEAALGRPVRMANDADCLALSEAADGAAADAQTAFAVILGTGVGGGVAVRGALLQGPNAVAGEWGHNPLPWLRAEWNEWPAPACWCGKSGCIETWLSGPGLAADHQRVNGIALSGEDVVAAAQRGESAAQATLARYADRLARALASVINLIDPEVIVLGGGLSRVAWLYEAVTPKLADWVFSDRVDTRVVAARHGDSSGVLGAARLWPLAS